MISIRYLPETNISISLSARRRDFSKRLCKFPSFTLAATVRYLRLAIALPRNWQHLSTAGRQDSGPEELWGAFWPGAKA